MEQIHKEDLSLKDLGHYNGTEQYHKLQLFNEINLTDGIMYIMKNGYSWLVNDILSVIKFKLFNEEFLSVKLILNKNKGKMLITDGNEKILYTQKYPHTNAEREIKLFFTNGVLMLSGEY